MRDVLKEMMKRNKLESMTHSFEYMGPIVFPKPMSVERIDTTGMLIRDMKEIAALLKEHDEFLDLDAKEALNKTIGDLSNQISKLAENASLPMFKVGL